MTSFKNFYSQISKISEYDPEKNFPILDGSELAKKYKKLDSVSFSKANASETLDKILCILHAWPAK